MVGAAEGLSVVGVLVGLLAKGTADVGMVLEGTVEAGEMLGAAVEVGVSLVGIEVDPAIGDWVGGLVGLVLEGAEVAGAAIIGVFVGRYDGLEEGETEIGW